MMNMLRDENFYYQYEQNGGTIVMPKEIFWELYNDSKKEIQRLNNIIDEVAKDIIKELNYNNHLSCGVALAIRQKLIDYKELKEGK